MVITLTGSNTFLMQQKLKKLAEEFIAEYSDLAFERIDAEEAEAGRIIESVSSVPFLASKKMVVVRNPSANKALTENIERLLEAAAGSTDLVLYDPSADKRTKYYKTLKKLTQFEEYTELDERQLAAWLSSEAKEQGGALSISDAQYLVQRVGSDQMLLSNELNKLITHNPEITRTTINQLTEATPQGKIFDLLDAAFAGNKQKALKLYDEQRAQKVEPQQILGMIGWQLNILAIVKSAGSRSPQLIAKEAGISPFVVSKSSSICRNLSLAQIKNMVSEALNIDVRAKTTSLNLDEALKNYIVTLS